MDSEMMVIKNQMRLVVRSITINIRIIIIFGLMGTFISFFTFLIPIDNMYKATASVCSTLFSDNYDNTKSVRLMANFMDLFESTLIQNKVVDVTGNSITIEELINMTSLIKSPSSTVLTIATRHKNPAIAIETANAIAHVLIIETDKLFETPSGIKILDRAFIAGFEYTSNRMHFIVAFLLAFLFVAGACIYYIIKTLSSDKVLFIEDCTLDGTLEVMGVIPYGKFSSSKQT